MSIGGHHSAAAGSTTWLTPPAILDALGGWQSFDLDPCAAPAPRPWFTAWQMNAEADGDGLAMDWHGRVFLNPPYSSGVIEAWLRKNWSALCRFDTETLWAQMPVSVMGTAPKPNSMCPNDGEYCPAFKARDANKETSR